MLSIINPFIIMEKSGANPGKKLLIGVNGENYARYPVKTKLITPNDKDIIDIIKQYVILRLQIGDIVFVSEKIIAIMQNRAYNIEEVKASILAKIFSRFVTRNPAGIGLSIPETMQLAIEECGLFRIILAVFTALFTKPFGVKGMFYRVAGWQAAAIDGPVPYAIPPYNKYAIKGPKNPGGVAIELSESLGAPVAIIDANDLGVEILGTSAGVDKDLLRKTLKDNPLGQSDEQTPIGILRKVISNF